MGFLRKKYADVKKAIEDLSLNEILPTKIMQVSYRHIPATVELDWLDYKSGQFMYIACFQCKLTITI